MDVHAGHGSGMRRGDKIAQLDCGSADQDIPVLDERRIERAIEHIVKTDRVDLVEVDAKIDLEITNIAWLHPRQQAADRGIVDALKEVSPAVVVYPAILGKLHIDACKQGILTDRPEG